MKNRIYIVSFLFFAFCSSFAQHTSYSLQVFQKDTISDSIKLKIDKEFRDSLSINRELKSFLSSLHDKGYLTASFDSIQSDSTSVKAWLHTGNKYLWGTFKFDSLDNFILRKLGIKTKYFENRPVRFSRFNKTRKKIIQYYENNGYPFASLDFKNVNIKEHTIEGTLIFSKNDLFLVKDLIIKGDANISNKYFTSYIGIKPESEYNEKKINSIGLRTKEILFINEIKPSEVEFRDGEAYIFTYLENRKANYFTGILGFLPDDTEKKKLVLTGEVNLFLINSFKKGESISFEWKKLELASQELNIKFIYPYLFSLPLGLDVEFDLFKKDSLYLNLHTNIGSRFLFEGENYLKIYVDYKQSSLISDYGLESLTVLPPYADTKTNYFGLEYHFSNLDYKYNPRKGIDMLLYSGVGEKEIQKNTKIPDIAYEGLDMKSTQWNVGCDVSFYKKITKNTVVRLQSLNGRINNPDLFENELFRIGGLNTLRGFDEKAILASAYSILNIEYRFLFEENSNFYFFWNGAYYEKDTRQDFVSDFPFGFGAGINFETKAGIFSLNYALGKQFDNPIQFRAAKVHFGYVTRF